METHPEKSAHEISGHEGTLTTADQPGESDFSYLSGWRLHVIMIGQVADKNPSPILLGLWLTTTELACHSQDIVY
jgi:hypothetical protein